MAYRSNMIDDQFEMSSAQKGTAINYARRLLRCMCCLLVLTAIIVTATAVLCGILVYKQVVRKGLKEDPKEGEATHVADGVIEISAVHITDDLSAKVTFTTMSTSFASDITSVTTEEPTNSVSHFSTDGILTDKPELCREGFIQRGKSCYAINNDTATWTEAMETCILDFGGYLAIINDADENTFLKGIARSRDTYDLVMINFRVRLKKTKNPTHSRLRFDLEKLRNPDVAGTFQATIAKTCWLGGSDAFKEGDWRWIRTMEHISSDDFTDWHPSQPDNYKDLDFENCLGFWVAFDYQWNDINCDYKSMFVCETDLE